MKGEAEQIADHQQPTNRVEAAKAQREATKGPVVPVESAADIENEKKISEESEAATPAAAPASNGWFGGLFGGSSAAPAAATAAAAETK